MRSRATFASEFNIAFMAQLLSSCLATFVPEFNITFVAKLLGSCLAAFAGDFLNLAVRHSSEASS
jgi:uncharacterized membrane protein